jgi:uncharacterized membrane protein
MHNSFRNDHYIIKDGKVITFVSLSLKQVYKYQMKLKKKREVKGRENTSEGYNEIKHLDSSTNETNMNLT